MFESQGLMKDHMNQPLGQPCC